jgi:alpha-tubulin suppressor-like RCC1 family protein
MQGHIYTMGRNNKGQLGIGSFGQANSTVPKSIGSPSLVESLRMFKVEQISCGSDFTFAIVRANADALKEDLVSDRCNEIYSWGNNAMG